MRGLLLAAVVLLLASAAAPAADARDRLLAPRGACAGDANQTAPVAVQERAMRCLHAYARRKAGVGALRHAPRLDASAASKAARIVSCRSFSHTPCGERFTAAFRRAGYGGSSWGENLAWGSGARGSARAVFGRWLASRGHRGNLLKASWRDLGIEQRYAPRIFGAGNVRVWVAHFGRP